MVRLDTESLDQTFITNLPETKRKLYVKIIDHNDHIKMLYYFIYIEILQL